MRPARGAGTAPLTGDNPETVCPRSARGSRGGDAACDFERGGGGGLRLGSGGGPGCTGAASWQENLPTPLPLLYARRTRTCRPIRIHSAVHFMKALGSGRDLPCRRRSRHQLNYISSCGRAVLSSSPSTSPAQCCTRSAQKKEEATRRAQSTRGRVLRCTLGTCLLHAWEQGGWIRRASHKAVTRSEKCLRRLCRA